MNAADLKLDIKDVFKVTGFIVVTLGMWYDLKTDFAVHREEHRLIEYRIIKLEASLMATFSYRPMAILPKEIKFESE